VLPLQHPAGQDAASQTHRPLVTSHSCPTLHAPQAAPPLPHAALDCEAYALHDPAEPPLQQPAAHVLASQTHAPCVVSHSPPAHAAQAAPPAPHTDAVCEAYGTHALPLQHPCGHDVASQTHWPVAVLHSCVEAHAEQAAPAEPQTPLVCDANGTQVAPLQHPFGHDAASHTQ
jgi:hypothetical protein